MNKNEFEFVKKALKVIDLENFLLFTDANQNGEHVFRLKDEIDGNLDNIEAEEFDTLGAVLDRLDSYHEDYLDKYDPEDAELIEFLQNDKAADFLCGFTAKDYERMLEQLIAKNA